MSWRFIVPFLLAVVAAVAIDRATDRRRLTPPLFVFRHEMVRAWTGALRRLMVIAGLAFVLWLGVFGPLGLIGQPQTTDFDSVPIARLFQLHAIFAVFVVIWYVIGFSPRVAERAAAPWWSFPAQLGFTPRAPSSSARGEPWLGFGVEIGLGVLLGIAAWMIVLGVLLLIGSLIYALGGDEALPAQPPEMIGWVIGLPWLVRLGISLSAGIVEETFFRGLLQPRCGIALSTVLFVLAHAGYEQPLMLVGVTLLSLFFASLVVWRQSLWAAITAHAVFDAIQLLIVIPSIYRLIEGGAGSDGLMATTLAVWLCGVGSL